MFLNISFYKFFHLQKSQLKKYKEKLLTSAKSLEIKGLFILSTEGLNASFCGPVESVKSFKEICQKIFNQEFFYKDSLSKIKAFKRFSVKIKKEIISLGQTYKTQQKNGHLSPQEWELKLQKKAQILDVRNNYEIRLGHFETASHLNMENFQEFPQKIEKSFLNKEKETLIYCTGGIRCEKAIEVMKNKGFKKVYQLEGGILNYLKYFPHSHFKKDCFIFDHRVALDQNLKVSRNYSLCPHCGQAGDLKIKCQHCSAPCVICSFCEKKFSHYKTCSKNCAYHFKKGHLSKKKNKISALT
ncbi:MAG: hypothetical protein GDA46_06950 [Bdellovibrionales bacterium]|nr:hypothetical protein [Bdellovibrionales bacterium]